MGLPKRVTYGNFFTYLPDTLRRRLRALQLTDEQMADWDNVQGVVIKALSSPISRIQAKTQLQIVKQGSTESIRDFVERLTTLIDRCYDDTVEAEAKTLILKDTFVKGLYDERVSLAVLAESEDLPLPELVKIATKHELARKAYSLSHQPQKGEEVFSVLTVNQEDKRTIGNLNDGKREIKKRCYGCGSAVHLLSRCPHQRSPFTRQRQPDRINRQQPSFDSFPGCWHCGGPHLRRNCTHWNQRHIWGGALSKGRTSANLGRYTQRDDQKQRRPANGYIDQGKYQQHGGYRLNSGNRVTWGQEQPIKDTTWRQWQQNVDKVNAHASTEGEVQHMNN